MPGRPMTRTEKENDNEKNRIPQILSLGIKPFVIANKSAERRRETDEVAAL